MTRQEIYKQMQDQLGLVPSFFKSLPDSVLELEWDLFNKIENAPGAIPNKYRELIGVGISAATKCRYCSLFHTEMAKLHGATQDEIEEALLFAKNSAGWSTYINGEQVDYDQFKKEVLQIRDYIQRQGKAATTLEAGGR